MNYSSFRQLAIESASKYYDYLVKNNKGLVENRVFGMEQSGRNLLLDVGSSLSSKGLDSLMLRISADIYETAQIHPVEYRRATGTLVIRPAKKIAKEILSRYQTEGIDSFTIVSDLRFLVERVRKWYVSHGNDISLPEAVPAVVVPSFGDMEGGAPSEEQYSAVKNVLSNSLSYVWGAPGTGKTRYVLANCVLAYLREDRKILLVAPTNNALDQMLGGVLEVLFAAGIPASAVRRLGTPTEALARSYPGICESASYETRRAALDERLTALRRKLAGIAKYQTARSDLLAITELRADLSEVSKEYQRRSFSHGQTDALQKAIGAAEAEINRLDALIRSDEKWMNSLRGRAAKLFQTYKYSAKQNDNNSRRHRIQEQMQLRDETAAKLRGMDAANRSAADLYFSARDNLCIKFRTICRSSSVPDLKKLNDLSPESLAHAVEDILPKLARLADDTPENLSIEFAALSSQITEVESSISALDEEDRPRWDDVRVLAMTIDRYILETPWESENSFIPEHIFMDEAAYCSLIKGYTLLASGKPLTLLGDHSQLPPVSECPESELRAEDQRPIFLWAQSSIHLESAFALSFAELYSAFSNSEDPLFSRMVRSPLSVTYRFGPSLAAALQTIYPGFRSALTLETEIRYIDAPALASDTKRTSLSECSAIKALVSEFAGMREDFAVLAPYQNQVRLLSKSLSRGAASGRIMTVHASQGREFDTVVLSVTDTSDRFFVDSSNHSGRAVLNTAISRTKKRLILVLDYNYWSAQNGQLIKSLLDIALPYRL